MSRTIEDRVVQMHFDNGRFERNVQTTLGTLSKLDEKLKFKNAASGFKNIDKAASDVSLSGMSNAIDNISSRFSTMGIVGMSVINNLTNSIINKVKSTISTVTGLIDEGGKRRALNIEQAKFQLEGLGVAWEDISGDINYGVKDTAYGLDSAAKVASQLVASSVELGDPMRTALRSISGVAAMTSSTYDDIGRIYTTVAGNGRLMTEQLNQFSGRGLNAAATLRDYFNSSEENMTKFYELYTKTAKKSNDKVVKGTKATEANIRTMVTNGAISFEIFSEAMDKAYGEHAKSANKTYEGSLSNVKAALSRIGADFHTPKLENLKNIFNALIPVIDGVHNALKPVSDEYTKTTTAITKFITHSLSFFDKFGDETFEKNGSGFINFLKNASKTVGEWREKGGLENVLQSVVNVGRALKSIFMPIKDAFKDIFPPVTSKNLLDISLSLLEFTKKLKLSDSASDDLKNTFKGLFSICKIMFNGIRIGFNIFGGFLKVVKPLAGVILDLTGNLGGLITGLDKSADKSNAFGKALELSSKIFETLASGVGSFSKKIVKHLDAINKKIGGISGFFKKIGTAISQVFKVISTALENVFSSSGLTKMSDIINGGIFVYALDLFRRILIYIRKLTTSVNPFTDMFDQLRDTLFEYQRDLKAGVIMKIAVAVALLAGSIVLMSSIESDKLTSASVAILGLFSGLMVAMNMMSKIKTGIKLKDSLNGLIQSNIVDDIATSLIKMAVAVLILSKAMENLADLEWDEIARGLAAVAGLVTVLTVSAIASSKLSGKASKGAKGLITMSIAISMLSRAIKKISKMSWEDIGKGLTTITGLMVILTTTSIVLSKKSSNLVQIGTGLIFVATAITILSKAIGIMGSMSWEQMGVGLITLSASLAVITSAILLITKKEKNLVHIGTGFLLLASAIKILSKALVAMGDMNWNQMGIALISLAASLTIVVSAVLLLTKKEKNLSQTGIGLLLIASAIKVLSSALMSMGSMSWEQMGIALISLAASLTIITVAVSFMKKALSGAAALLIISSALVTLSGALRIMGSMSWEQMGVGLITLASALTIIGVAGYALGPVVPVIIGLGAAITLIGVGCLTAGTGVLALSAGLIALSAAGGTVGSVLIGFITTILNYLPLLGVKLAECLVMFATTIAQSAPIISNSILIVLMEILTVLSNATPMITGFIFGILSALLWQIVDFVPEMTDAGMQLLIGFIDGISNNIEQLIGAVTNLAINFINGLANGIRDNQETIFNAIRNLMGSVIEIMITALQTVASLIPGIGDNISDKLEEAKISVREAFGNDEMTTMGNEAASTFSQAMSNNDSMSTVGSDFSLSFKNGLSNGLGDMGTIGNNTATGFLSGVAVNNDAANLEGTNIGNLFKTGLSGGLVGINQIGNDSSIDFINGISNKNIDVNNAGAIVADEATKGVETAQSGFKTAGEDSSTGFINGLGSKLKDVWEAGKTIGKKALEAAKKALDSHSPSKEFDKLGCDSDRGFANGLVRLSGLVEKSSSKVANRALSIMKNIFSDIADIIDGDFEYSPVVSPVIDMSELENGSRSINRMLSNHPTISWSSSIARVSDLSSTLKKAKQSFNDDAGAFDNYSNGNVYNYTQNNYSPKSLSRLDIYRQSKNLFSLQIAGSGVRK